MIDIVDALDLIDRCVHERGDSYRSPRSRDPAGPVSRRFPTCPAASDSIVTLVLTKAGTPHAVISGLASTSVADAYASGERDLNLTVGAVVVLRAAQAVERRGQTWGVAREAAVRAASRFADLMLPVAEGARSAAQADSPSIAASATLTASTVLGSRSNSSPSALA
jgi:hypothetical protein